MDEQPLSPEELIALATKISDQIDDVIEGQQMGAVWVAVNDVFFDLTKEFYGEAVKERILAILHEATFHEDTKDPTTRYTNALVDKGYDWPVRIGRAKKAGR